MTENYPYNIALDQNYLVYVGAVNHMSSSVYYVLNVKFGNLSDSIPNSPSGTPSTLLPLYPGMIYFQEGGRGESPIIFSITNGSISNLNSQIYSLQINNFTFNVDKSALWDSNTTVFGYQLVFELWLYNGTANSISYSNRFVDLRLNFTITS